MIGLAEVARARGAAAEAVGEEVGGTGTGQRGGLGHDRPVLEDAGLVDDQAGDELDPVRVVVEHRERERRQRDLARPGGLVARDDVVHVVADVVRGRVRVGAGHGDVVAPVELDVRVTERSLGEVVERFELGGELEIGLVEAEVLVAEAGLGELVEVVGVEAVVVLASRARRLRRWRRGRS